MITTLESRRRLSRAAAGLLAVGAVGGLQAAAATSAQNAAASSSAPTAPVASTRLDDTKAVLSATRTADDTATVRLTVYRRSDGALARIGSQVVGKRRGWFWHVVTGPAAVCGFSVTNTPRRAVEVRLAISPSIGCDVVTRHFHVEAGQLVPG